MDNIKDLTLTLVPAFRSGYHNGSLIVDGKGTAYRVSHVVKNRAARWNVLLPFMAFIIVDFVISEIIERYDFSLLKELVLIDIERCKDLWNERDEHARENVERCGGFLELYHYMITDGYVLGTDSESAAGGGEL